MSFNGPHGGGVEGEYLDEIYETSPVLRDWLRAKSSIHPDGYLRDDKPELQASSAASGIRLAVSRKRVKKGRRA